ncbi:MAG: MotA/TolQ/ExbB proton channel family protein [Planctomycetaceae bacterium]|nr:MotA/TolQ/ExbB proton channel family protein [Planctomycetaceae bacterium]
MEQLLDSITNALSGSPEIVRRAWAITLAGGPSMTAIWFVAFLMTALGANVWLTMTFSGMFRRSKKRIRAWVADPTKARGVVGRLVREARATGSADGASLAFSEYRSDELEPFDRQLKFMKICVNTAPLLGLFGTVTGMLATFAALASGSGGEQTMGDIAKGISEALITTEAGLVVALPGLFFHYYLTRKLRGFHNHLDDAETMCRKAALGRAY